MICQLSASSGKTWETTIIGVLVGRRIAVVVLLGVGVVLGARSVTDFLVCGDVTKLI